MVDKTNSRTWLFYKQNKENISVLTVFKHVFWEDNYKNEQFNPTRPRWVGDDITIDDKLDIHDLKIYMPYQN